MKKWIFLPFLAIYELVIFLPIFVVITVVAATTTGIFSTIFGDRIWGYYPGRIWSKLCCIFALVKVEVEGWENLERGKSYVFVANHQSVFDVFLIYGYLNHNFKWVMKKEIERVPLVGFACRAAGHIFIDRSNAMSAHRSIEQASRRLSGGVSVVMFPEGSRTRNGKIGRFRRGAFLLANDLKLPVVPITISGAFEVLPRTRTMFFPGKIKMTIHAPISSAEFSHENIQDLISLSYEKIESAL